MSSVARSGTEGRRGPDDSPISYTPLVTRTLRHHACIFSCSTKSLTPVRRSMLGFTNRNDLG